MRLGARPSTQKCGVTPQPAMNPQNEPSVLYNAMLYPLRKYSIRAAFWFQVGSRMWLSENEAPPCEIHAPPALTCHAPRLRANLRASTMLRSQRRKSTRASSAV